MIHLDGPPDGRYLALKPRPRQPGAPAGHLLHRLVQQQGGQRAGGGGVADAHLPGGDELVPRLDALARQVDAHLDHGPGLLPGHGRTLGDVAGAPAQLAVQHRRMIHLGEHPHVHRNHLGPRHPGHLVDVAGAPGDAQGHRRGNRGVGLGDPLGHHPVVRTQHQHTLALGLHLGGAQQPGHAGHHILQLPQTIEGLGYLVPMGAALGHGRLIQGLDGVGGGVK